MKNKKGEVAALLTLGLVLVGSLITLGISYLTTNNKISSNPRASCSASYHACSIDNPSYINGGYYISGSKYYKDSSCGTEVVEGVGNYCKNLNTDTGIQCPYKSPTEANSACGPVGSTTDGCAQGTYKCKPNTGENPTLICPNDESTMQSGPKNSQCSSICGAIGYYGNGHNGTYQQTVGNNLYCCCNKSAANSGGGGDRCCLTKKNHSSCNGNDLVSIFSESLSQFDIPLSSCDGDSNYGGTLDLCNPQNKAPGCYNSNGALVGSQGAAYDTSDPSYNPDLCKKHGYGPGTGLPNSVYACCKSDATTFLDCRESTCKANGLTACSGGGGAGVEYNPTCGNGQSASSFCIFGTNSQSKGPALCDGNSIRKDIQGCSPAPAFSSCSTFDGSINKCVYFEQNGSHCVWNAGSGKCIPKGGSSTPLTCSNGGQATCLFGEKTGSYGQALCGSGYEDQILGCTHGTFNNDCSLYNIGACNYWHSKGICTWDKVKGCLDGSTVPVGVEPVVPAGCVSSTCDTLYPGLGKVGVPISWIPNGIYTSYYFEDGVCANGDLSQSVTGSSSGTQLYNFCLNAICETTVGIWDQENLCFWATIKCPGVNEVEACLSVSQIR